MLSYIRGTIADIEENGIVVDCGGIGYHIFMPVPALSAVLRKNEEIMVHTYLQVKEDDMQLYGFLNKDDLQIFKLLIGVNGIGPKAGMGILSALCADEIRFAILAGDAAALSKAPGVGKKTAQKVILELKDKLNLQDAFEQKLTGHSLVADHTGPDDAVKEAVQALVSLGYSNSDALRAVKQAATEADMGVEELLKAALKRMV